MCAHARALFPKTLRTLSKLVRQRRQLRVASDVKLDQVYCCPDAARQRCEPHVLQVEDGHRCIPVRQHGSRHRHRRCHFFTSIWLSSPCDCGQHDNTARVSVSTQAEACGRHTARAPAGGTRRAAGPATTTTTIIQNMISYQLHHHQVRRRSSGTATRLKT